MEKYDVIIVGCGPAGVAAAQVLQQNQIHFCMIDHKVFPREKLCGGGITHKSNMLLQKFQWDIEKCHTQK